MTAVTITDSVLSREDYDRIVGTFAGNTTGLAQSDIDDITVALESKSAAISSVISTGSVVHYPTVLPYPQSAGYNRDVKANFAVTKMDSGLVKRRVMSNRKLTDVKVSWHFSNAELVVFESFVLDTLHQGSYWFTMLESTNGKYPYNGKYRFKGGSTLYKVVPVGATHFKVSAVLEQST